MCPPLLGGRRWLVWWPRGSCSRVASIHPEAVLTLERHQISCWSYHRVRPGTAVPDSGREPGQDESGCLKVNAGVGDALAIDQLARIAKVLPSRAQEAL